MTGTTSSGIDGLRAAVAGRVILPGDPDHDRSRLFWNGTVGSIPAVVVRCASPGDVVAALDHARRNGLEVAVRGGGHGHWSAAAPDEALLIDLGGLDRVAVDPAARRVRCGGGVTLGQLTAACQEHGLAVPVGGASHTGIGGLTLGGGIGWLTTMAGLTVDNLVSAEVVLVDGRIVRASETEHPDLFWALRGGGGNFGIVTEFEFRLHPVGPMVHMGMFFYGLDRAEEIIRLGLDTIADLPADVNGSILGINAPPAPFVPPELHFTPGVAVSIVGFGTAEDHAAALAPLRQAQPPLFEAVAPMPFVALQQFVDNGVPWGTHSYGNGLYFRELTGPAVAVAADALRSKRSPRSQLLVLPLAGAYREVEDADTAFGGSRCDAYLMVVEGNTTDAELFDGERQWVRSSAAAMRPFASGAGGYVNLTTDLDETALRATFGGKLQRLAAVKATYDPDNVLHLNPNITPA